MRPRPALAAALAAALTAGLAPFACRNVPESPAPRRAGVGLRGEAERLRASLSLREEAAQVLLVGVSGKRELSGASRDLLSSACLGGVILFGFNIPDEASGLASFCAGLQDAAAGSRLGIPLIVAVDHEGGSIFRFRGGGVTRLPPPLEVGERGPDYARALGLAAGRELRALGVNMALAPVVELLDGANEAFLGNRAYGREAGRVDRAAGAFIQGLQEAGTAAVAKHFPGNAAADPHHGTAVIRASRLDYERDYYPRFAQAARRGVSAIMASHAVFASLDPDRPATFSRPLLDGQLKSRMGFRGVVLTDDLYMRAVRDESPPELGAVQALAAGADMIMLSSGDGALRVRDAVVRAVEAGALARSRLDDAARRILELKLRFGLSADLDPALRAARMAALPEVLRADARDVAAALERASRGR